MQALLGFLTQVWELLLPWTILDPWEKGIRVRLGKRTKELGAGFHFLIPLVDRVETINVLPQRIVLPNQSLICLDDKVIAISGAIMYSIKEPLKVWLEVEDHDESLVTLALNLIAEYVSKVDSRSVTIDHLKKHVLPSLRTAALKWGIKVHDIGVKDLAPHKVHRFMSDEGVNLTSMFGN